MPVPGSWQELHAALTHFPIALLLTALFFDAGALLLRRPAWRDIGLAILSLAVISLPVALLSGYLAGRDMRRPPVSFDSHWKAAVATFIIAALLLLWRLRTRSRVERVPHFAMMGLALASALMVGYTGHMGGEMVYGGRSYSEEVPLAAASTPAPDENAARGKAAQVAQAAGRVEAAAGKVAVATERLASRASAPAAPAPQAAAPSTSAALDDAKQKLERAATRFEASAAKMEAATRALQARDEGKPAPPLASAAKDEKALASRTNAAPVASAPGAKMPAAAPVATAPPAASTPDPLLVAGRKLYEDDELGCTGCHKLNGEGGRSGPDLTFAGRLHPDIEWQIAHLKDPKSKIPNSSMPSYADIPEADLKALGAFMASLK